MSLGINPSEPWAAWPGNHNGVWAVARDESGVYFAGAGEGTAPIVKQSHGEKQLWTVPNWLEAWQGGVDLSVVGGTVFMLQGNGKMWLLDAQSGIPKNPTPIDILWEENDRDHTPGYGATRILDTDARDDQFVASYANHNAIRWLHPESGKVVGEAAIPEPLGIALAPDNRVLAISKDRVLSLTRADKTPKTLITGLTSPWRLAVDQKNGDIFVAERGESQQVKKYSKNGVLLKTFGPRGGRNAEGLYNPMAFREITTITADGAGGFYTCEQDVAPRRTAPGISTRMASYCANGMADKCTPTSPMSIPAIRRWSISIPTGAN